MKYLFLSLLSLSAFAQSFGQVRERNENIDVVSNLIQRGRCQVSYIGEVRPLEIYQTLGQFLPNPFPTPTPGQAHDLSVFKGSLQDTLTLKLIEWMPPRSRRVVIKEVTDLPIVKLSVKMSWNAFDRVEVTCD